MATKFRYASGETAFLGDVVYCTNPHRDGMCDHLFGFIGVVSRLHDEDIDIGDKWHGCYLFPSELTLLERGDGNV